MSKEEIVKPKRTKLKADSTVESKEENVNPKRAKPKADSTVESKEEIVKPKRVKPKADSTAESKEDVEKAKRVIQKNKAVDSSLDSKLNEVKKHKFPKKGFIPNKNIGNLIIDEESMKIIYQRFKNEIKNLNTSKK